MLCRERIFIEAFSHFAREILRIIFSHPFQHAFKNYAFRAAGNYPVTPGSAPNISGPAQQYPQYAPQAPAAPQGYQPPVDIPQGYPQAPASTYPQQGAAPQYPGYPQQQY